MTKHPTHSSKDTSAMILFNMREEKILDASKNKKRKKGRALKISGDYCLMTSSPQDALK